MALYAKSSGGNWSAAGTWSSTGSGGVDNAGPPTAADDVILEAGSGNVTIDATSVCKTLNTTSGTGTYAGVLTHNGFVLTVSGSMTLNSGMTYTPLATSTVTFNASSTLTTGGLLFPLMTHTSGTLTLADNLSFMASKVITMTLSGTAVNLAGFTISGNSSINRIFIRSSILGTGRQITVASGSFANADFRDITFSSAVDVNLSAITGLSGDGGGNTITGGGSTLTFTPSATQTATGTASFTWSTHGWTSRVPLPQDDVVVNNSFVAGRTVTMDMPRSGRSLDFSGSSGGPTFSITIATEIYGSLTLNSGLTWTAGSNVSFLGRGSYFITSAGKNFGATVAFAGVGGTYTLLDNLSLNASTLSFTNGTFDASGFNVTANLVQTSGTSTRTVTMGTGTWTLNSTAATTVWIFNAVTGLTLSGASSTIVIAAASANTRTFSGGGLTYGVLRYTVAGSTGGLDIVGANTFSEIQFSDVTNARTLRFTAATTTTFTGNGIVGNGSSGKVLVLTSITAANHTLTKTSGQISIDWWDISRSQAGGGANYYAGANSTDNGNNAGWVFTAPPTTTTGGRGALGLQSRMNLQNLQGF